MPCSLHIIKCRHTHCALEIMLLVWQMALASATAHLLLKLARRGCGAVCTAHAGRVCVCARQVGVSLVLSFMVVWDLPTIAAGVRSLQASRLGPIYNEVAPSVAVFSQLFGKALQAQVLPTCTPHAGLPARRQQHCVLHGLHVCPGGNLAAVPDVAISTCQGVSCLSKASCGC